MSNLTLLRGEATTVTIKFRSNILLPEAPEWKLYDWEDDVLLSGTATPASDGAWQAEITVPSALEVPDGAQTVALEFTGEDDDGKVHTVTRLIDLVDGLTPDRPYGILWWHDFTAIEDVVLFDRAPSAIQAQIIEGYGDGKQIAAAPVELDVLSATSAGRAYKVTIPVTKPATANAGGFYPHLLVVTASYASGQPDVVIKPVYVMTPIIATRLNKIKRYLDKGRITDIDPNLQWADEEMVHYLMEGVEYVNGAGVDATFWTPENLPSSMESYVTMASCWVALNARYLAEGMNSFEFQGANNVSLTFDRKQAIETKMNELKSALDNGLNAAKKSAIRTQGGGQPLGGRGRIGRLGISLGPMINVSGWYRGYPYRGFGSDYRAN